MPWCLCDFIIKYSMIIAIFKTVLAQRDLGSLSDKIHKMSIKMHNPTNA